MSATLPAISLNAPKQSLVQKIEQTKPFKIATSLKTTAVLGATLGALLLPAGAVGGVAKSLIPKTLSGKIIGGLATPIALSAVVHNPASVAKAGEAVYDFEKTGIQIASGGKGFVEGAKEYVTEHPVASVVGGLAIAGATAKAVIPAIATSRQTEAIQEQTEAIREQKVLNNQPLPAQAISPAYSQDAVSATSPPPPPIEAIPTDSKPLRKKYKKKAVEPRRQTIKQEVEIDIINAYSPHRTTKNYLNRIEVFN